MPYKTVRTEQRTSAGTRVILKEVWYDVPKKHAVSSLLGTGSFVEKIANEPLQYEYRGKVYQDIPSEMIARIDDELWNGNVDFSNRAFAMVERAREKMEEMKTENINKKGVGVVKHNSFKSIFKELKKIYADCMAVCNPLFEEYEVAQKAWSDVRASVAADEKTKFLAEADYILAGERFKNAREEIARATQQRVAELKKELEEAVRENYRVRPDRLDTAALELLRLGVLGDDDMVQIAHDNVGNPTMLAVIKKYAEERTDNQKMRLLENEINAALDSKKELDAFNMLCGYGDRAYGMDSALRKSLGGFFDKAFDGTIENVSDRSFEQNSDD